MAACLEGESPLIGLQEIGTLREDAEASMVALRGRDAVSEHSGGERCY